MRTASRLVWSFGFDARCWVGCVALVGCVVLGRAVAPLQDLCAGNLASHGGKRPKTRVFTACGTFFLTPPQAKNALKYSENGSPVPGGGGFFQNYFPQSLAASLNPTYTVVCRRGIPRRRAIRTSEDNWFASYFRSRDFHSFGYLSRSDLTQRHIREHYHAKLFGACRGCVLFLLPLPNGLT